jgi:hypothetical protein
MNRRARGKTSGMMRNLLAGIAAGAAGTTALNAVTYLDMATRARGVRGVPQAAVAPGMSWARPGTP